jgi:hypothetical protein
MTLLEILTSLHTHIKYNNNNILIAVDNSSVNFPQSIGTKPCRHIIDKNLNIGKHLDTSMR